MITASKIHLMIVVIFLTPVLSQAAFLSRHLPPIEQIITASRYIDIQPNSTVISAKELSLHHDAILAQTLDTETGVHIKQNGGAGGITSIQIQGANTNHVLVMQNGIPIHDPIYGSFDWTTINPDDVARIELFRGSMSAIYGANAIGGAINIITKKPTNESTLKLGLGSFNDRKLSITLGKTMGQLSYRLYGLMTRNDGYRPTSNFDNNAFSATIDFNPSDILDITINYAHTQSNRGNPGPITASWPPTTQKNETNQWFENIKVDISKWGIINTNFAQNNARLETTAGIQKYNAQTNSIQHEIILGTHSLAWGLEIQAAQPDDVMISRNQSVQNTAVFINDTLVLNSGLNVTLGGRMDRHSVFGDTPTYKLSSHIKLPYFGQIKVSYGTAFRAPTISDLYYYDAQPWGTSQGNPDLQPEKSSNIDAEWTLYFKDSDMIRIGLFQKNITNLIQWDSTDYVNWTVKNIGRAKIAGAEVEIRYNLFKQGSITLGLTYLNDAIDEQTGKWLIYRPKTKASICLERDLQYGTLALRSTYVDERSTETTGKTLPPYVTLDATYTLGELSFYVRNLLDTPYQETLGFPMPGRTAGIEVKCVL